jgi:cell division protein FtsB
MARRRWTIKPRFMLLMSLGVVVCFALIYAGGQRYARQQDEMIAQLELERQQMIDRNNELVRKIEFAKTDEYVERIAREELGLLKPGEVRYVTGQ